MNESNRFSPNESSPSLVPAVSHLIEIKTDLCGQAVYWQDDEDAIGRVTDVLVEPEAGWLVALLFQGHSGQEYLARQNAFSLSQQGVLVMPELVEPTPFGQLQGVLVRQRLIGSLVLTNEGYLLGRIYQVYLRPPKLTVIYGVARNWWAHWRNRDFFFPGQIARAYSYPTQQLIVPFNTMERWGQNSLEEVLRNDDYDSQYLKPVPEQESWRDWPWRREFHGSRDD